MSDDPNGCDMAHAHLAEKVAAVNMSPASRSKSKDKKAAKEPPKSSLKPSSHANTTGGTPASGYNPLLGTFHTFETAPVPSTSPLHVNGRFRNIDETDDHNGNSSGTALEYDSVSNNGSWSGESEDHKEKTSLPRQEAVPGADNDKREKIRQKNERKHQRQKERRAQELHEKCSGYLMSRKLEALAQQLVAMGFSQERATMALILNEGRVEESVAWLFESGEEDNKHIEHNNLDGGGNLKIDISEELARITDMEIRYKSSKQEVERAIVSCEGDLDKAEEILKAQKEETPAGPPKPEETGDPPIVVANSKVQPTAYSQNGVRVQTTKAASSTIIQQKRDEKDFNYTKVPTTVGSSVESPVKTIQVLKKIPPKSEWVKPQPIAVPADKRWPNSGSNPSASSSLTSPSPPPAKTEARYIPFGNELKNLQLGSVKEPVIVMQRPQSVNIKQVPNGNVSSSPPGSAMGWYPPNRVETVKPNGFAPPVAVSRSLSPGPSPNVSSNPLYNQLQYQSQQQFVSSNSSMDPQGSMGRLNGIWSRGGASPALAPASSLGLFSGIGSNGSPGSSSPVDWNTGGSMMQFDYTSIDWSLDRGSLTNRPNGLWTAANYSMQNNARIYDSFGYGVGVKSAMRPILSNGNGAVIPGLQDGVGASEQSGGGSREWTSPFEERDIFSLPRQFVSSPTL
ncbi:hypothetical protein BUALT_Bualt13G0046900 [Buddleja alternifolia]|uniref:UBA domain-containing protein n=1 Tax=Buddleja alternifolia TaxID=168488 RepID=A0AAV6WKH1_9LAMI|nr:hypothetical protein BUALT_Bualt13G0046900 [Buddleja alternifolia]